MNVPAASSARMMWVMALIMARWVNALQQEVRAAIVKRTRPTTSIRPPGDPTEHYGVRRRRLLDGPGGSWSRDHHTDWSWFTRSGTAADQAVIP